MARETEVLRENLPQCLSVHQKSHMTWLGIEPGSPRWEAAEWPPELRHNQTYRTRNWSQFFQALAGSYTHWAAKSKGGCSVLWGSHPSGSSEVLLLYLFCWRMAYSGMFRRVALVRTDVSEELNVSFIRVTRISELERTLAVTSNWRTQIASAASYSKRCS
jgi:hypothetical protein